MEDTVDVEGGEVVDHVESVGDVGCIEDKVEGIGPRLLPVGFGGDDEVLRAAFDGVFFLVWRVGEGIDFGAEVTSELKAEMSKTATKT